MYVTFVIFSSVFLRKRAKSRICSRISFSVKLRISPILPVSQKVQPIGHPTWQDTQTEFLDVVGFDEFGLLCFISTASTFLLSWRVISALMVWLSLLTASFASILSGHCSLSWSRNWAGRVWASSQFSIRSLKIACRIWVKRKAGWFSKSFSSFVRFIFCVNL